MQALKHPLLRDILIKTKKKLFQEFYGEHQSVFNGNGLEFSEVREYTINDDVRRLNWKIMAKNRKPSVNVFHEHRQLSIVLVYLNSGGLAFGTTRSKKELATEVLSILGFAATSKKDSVTTLFFDREPRHFFKPTRSQSSVELNFETAMQLDPLGCTLDFRRLSDYLLESIKRKSILFLIGDFWERPDLRLLASKHELYCVVIRDKAEEDFKLLGEFELIDTASLDSRSMELDARTLQSYNEKVRAHDQGLFTHFNHHRIRYEKIYTDDNVYVKLDRLLRI